MSYKLATVVGARPQFVKAAVVSDALAGCGGIEEAIIHTGQHFDENMSQSFFAELGIPSPKMNLGISGGSHAEMTARMLVGLEEALLRESPDAVLLYGDTNSTLAAALAAAKLHIPIVHVEAGARTNSKTNPEEINRICTDHMSSLLLACTEGNLDNLHREGLAACSKLVGDPMLDAFLDHRNHASKPTPISIFDGQPIELPERFFYLTCHREENTGKDVTLSSILDFAKSLDYPVVYPVHPRVRKRIASLPEEAFENVCPIEPVSYLESIFLLDHSEQVVTDSGGLQREAFFSRVKCTTLLDFEVWPETMVGNRNILAKPDSESILSAIQKPQFIDESYHPFGTGDAASRIVREIENFLGAE